MLTITDKTLLKLSRLSHNDAYMRLKSAKFNDGSPQFAPEQVKKYLEQVDNLRSARQKDAARARRYAAAWDAVIAPLSREINSVGARVSKMRRETQGQAVPESDANPKLDFYASYLKVLQTLSRKLRALQGRDMNTPEDEYRATYDVPDTTPTVAWGKSWADWVPAHIKDAMRQEHSRLQQAGTRTLSPIFSRTSSIEQANRKLRAKIFQAWQDEKNQLLTILDSGNDPNPDHTRATIEMIEYAEARLNEMPLAQKPLTAWTRYIGTETRARITRENRTDWINRPSNQPVEQPTLGEGEHWDDM
jgi:hypothetical protein